MKAILISIRKEWWDKIKTGRKKIELRKTAPKKLEGTCTCYVYVPEYKAIVGQFLLAGVALVQPSEELEQTSQVPIEKQIEYKGDGSLYGWLIAMPAEYTCKFNLTKLLGVKRAPQSWQYCRVATAADRAEAKLSTCTYAEKYRSNNRKEPVDQAGSAKILKYKDY